MNNKKRNTQNDKDAKDLLAAVCFAALLIGVVIGLRGWPW